METLTVNPRQLATDLADCIAADQPAMIWGSPGIGKSQVVQQVADRDNRTVYDVRGNVKEAPDFTGYLCLTLCKPGQPPQMTAPADLPPMDLAAPSLLFLDEINGSARDVQSAMYGLVLERRINSYHLPKDCAILAAGNLATDRGQVQPMPTPLKNRFVHYIVTPDVDQWLTDYALPRNLNADVISWHNWQKSKAVNTLMAFDPKSDEPAFASPRSWAAMARILDRNPNPSLATVCGTIGSGIGVMFHGYIRDKSQLPPVDLIWLNPNAAPVPDEPSALYAMAGILGESVSVPTMAQFVTYLERLPSREYSAMAMDIATRRSPALAQTPAFIPWAKANAYILGLTQ